jgi:hypothetical protein
LLKTSSARKMYEACLASLLEKVLDPTAYVHITAHSVDILREDNNEILARFGQPPLI